MDKLNKAITEVALIYGYMYGRDYINLSFLDGDTINNMIYDTAVSYENIFGKDRHNHIYLKSHYLGYRISKEIEKIAKLNSAGPMKKYLIKKEIPETINYFEEMHTTTYYELVTENLKTKYVKEKNIKEDLYQYYLELEEGSLINVVKKVHEIEKEELEQVVKNLGIPVIILRKYFYLPDNNIACINQYENYNNLVIAEVPLESEEKVEIKVPEWFGLEVTGQEEYYNENIWRELNGK